MPENERSLLSDPEAERFLESVDPDVVLVTDYLTGALTVGQMYALEARLSEDEAFYRKVAPLLAFWDAPLLFDDLGTGESKVRSMSLSSDRGIDDEDDEERMRESWAQFLTAIGGPQIPWREPRRLPQ